MFKKAVQNQASKYSYISPVCHKCEAVLFPPEKLVEVESTSLGVKYKNKEVAVKL